MAVPSSVHLNSLHGDTTQTPRPHAGDCSALHSGGRSVYRQHRPGRLGPGRFSFSGWPPTRRTSGAPSWRDEAFPPERWAEASRVLRQYARRWLRSTSDSFQSRDNWHTAAHAG